MIAIFAAFLETVAVLAVASAAACSLLGPALLVLRRLRIPPALRADLTLVLGALPAMVVLVGAVAVTVPGALDALGLGADHCHEHQGHGHLCLVHAGDASPMLVLLGGLALAATLGRAGRWVVARGIAARDLTALFTLGAESGYGREVVLVNTRLLLCHCAGAFDRRVLISAPLVAQLDPELLGAAVEHERAHLRRRDVLARDLLDVLGLLAWPGVRGALVQQWEEAAEQAADAAAAARLGGPVMAQALVAVARLALVPAPGTMPLVGARLRRRVQLLLEEPPEDRPAMPLALIPAMILLFMTLGAINADPLHHAAETLTHLLAGA